MSSSSTGLLQVALGWPLGSLSFPNDKMTDEALILRLTLPPPVNPPYQIISGTVVFFNDDINKSSSVQTSIRLDDYQVSKRHVMPSVQIDDTDFVLYNLPIGTVLTLMDWIRTDTENVFDLKDCNVCIDLVGTGKTEATDLRPVGMINAAASFFWRKVDLKIGAIELFADPKFQGRRTTLFLSEWAPGAVHSLRGWSMDDNVSSIRWYTLQDRQTATLYSGLDGNENQYNNIKSWGGFKEIANMDDVGFDDTVSSFKWEALVPEKEIIEPFVISSANTSSSFSLFSNLSGTNNTSIQQSVDISLVDTKSQTIYVETSDTNVATVSTKFSSKTTEGVEGVGSSSQEWSIELIYTYSQTNTKSTSDTHTVELNVKPQLFAPPYTIWQATIEVTIGNLPKTEFHTKAQRWYKEAVTGGVADPENKGLYKRVEDVTVEMTGGLACRTKVNIDARVIPGHEVAPAEDNKATPATGNKGTQGGGA